MQLISICCLGFVPFAFSVYSIDSDGRLVRNMKLWDQHKDVVLANWHLGFTAFGGPPVQFQTVSSNSREPLGNVRED